MKKIVLAISIIASIFVLASCKSPMTSASNSGSAATSSAPMHHDYKGEAGMK